MKIQYQRGTKKILDDILYGSKKIFLFTIRFVCGFELKPIYFLFKKFTRTQEKHTRKMRNMYRFCFQVQINLFFLKNVINCGMRNVWTMRFVIDILKNSCLTSSRIISDFLY